MFPAVMTMNPLGLLAPGLRAGIDPAALMPLVFGGALWVVLLVLRSRKGPIDASRKPSGTVA